MVALLLLFDACKKENIQDIVPSNEAEIALRTGTPTLKNNQTFERNRNVSKPRLIKLGKKRVNPYTVEVMTKAWNKVAPQARLTQLPTTDLYVKFSPTDFDQLAILDDLDIELFDHPLDHEILQDGDYYMRTGAAADDIPEYYAVVPPNFSFPSGVAHQVLEQLHLPEYDTHLTQEAFRLTNNKYTGEPKGKPTDYTNMARMCYEGEPGVDWPICQCDLLIGTPDYQECVDDVTAPPPPPPAPTLNDCGCPVSGNRRHPAGKVTVEDTQLGEQPVINVRIVARDNWFKVKKTFTDENGCWRINSSYSGKAKMKIRFKSDRITVRGIRGARFWEYAFAVRDKFTWWGPDFNDMCVNFMPNDDDSSPAKKYWYAAHANNAVYEFDEYAAQDGIASPPDDLEVLIANYNTAASAPMINQMQKNVLFSLTQSYIADGVVYVAINELIDDFILKGFAAALTATGLYNLFKAYLLAFAPDVFYGYGGETFAPNDNPSDEIKNTFYHEYGHATHFGALPNKIRYWLLEILTIVNNASINDGYGDGTQIGAERVGIVEAWGSYIGDKYADSKYGVNHGEATANPANALVRRHIYRNESARPDPIPETNFNNGRDWFPVGLFLDCIDDTAHNGPPDNIAEGIGIGNDMVQGFTTQDCFNALITGSPATMNDLRGNLINISPGQGAAINTLFTNCNF